MLPLNNISKLKLLEIVARIPFFKLFTIEQRELLLHHTKAYQCKEGHIVQSELDHNSHFYIVLSGNIEIVKQGGGQALGVILKRASLLARAALLKSGLRAQPRER